MSAIWTPPTRKLSLRPDNLQHAWAEGRVTSLDMAIVEGSDDGFAELIDEVAGIYPEMRLTPARDIQGTDYKQLVRVGLPKVGFRSANEGVTSSKGRYEKRTAECHMLDTRWEADQLMADGHPDGPEDYIATEAEGTLEATFAHLAAMFYYGRVVDPKGGVGIVDLYDRAKMEVSAGGTGSDRTSIYAVRFGRQGLQWMYGNGMGLQTSDVQIREVKDDDGNPYDAYVQKLQGWPGLKCNNRLALGRLKDITTQADKTVTDALIAKLIEKFPTGRKPDLLLMAPRSVTQLQESRIGIDGKWPDRPTSSNNIPIEETDAISLTEKASL